MLPRPKPQDGSFDGPLRAPVRPLLVLVPRFPTPQCYSNVKSDRSWVRWLQHGGRNRYFFQFLMFLTLFPFSVPPWSSQPNGKEKKETLELTFTLILGYILIFGYSCKRSNAVCECRVEDCSKIPSTLSLSLNFKSSQNLGTVVFKASFQSGLTLLMQFSSSLWSRTGQDNHLRWSPTAPLVVQRLQCWI